MNTDELVASLAAHPRTMTRGYVAWRYGAAVAGGTACTALAMAAALGPRHDLAHAMMLPMFWVKLAFVTAIAVLALAGAYRASVPARPTRPLWRAIAGVVSGMWTIAVVALARSAPQAREGLFLGDTWTTCPWLIAGLSIPVFVAVVWAMKGMAPTHLRRAGAMAGLASGALAALIYSIHCPELGAPFLGTWYVAGMIIPAAAGALLGKRLLHW